MLRVKVVIVNKLATFIKVVYVNISAEWLIFRLIWYFSLMSKHKKRHYRSSAFFNYQNCLL